MAKGRKYSKEKLWEMARNDEERGEMTANDKK